MAQMDAVQKRLFQEVADLHGIPEGAYNLRANGQAISRNTTANIDIQSKTDVSGIDISRFRANLRTTWNNIRRQPPCMCRSTCCDRSHGERAID